MKRLRLLVTRDCQRSCKGCCNDSVGDVPVWDGSADYDEIMITGGEPLLFVEELRVLWFALRARTNAKLYLYTALVGEKDALDALELIKIFDGVTITLHTEEDIELWLVFYEPHIRYMDLSVRLKVKKAALMESGSSFYSAHLKKRQEQYSLSIVDFVKDCPVSEGEVFMRLDELYTLKK